MTLIIKQKATSLIVVAVSAYMVACDSNPQKNEKLGKEIDRKAKCEYHPK